MTSVARALNLVRSVGQERAAIGAAQAEIQRGMGEVGQLSSYSSPTPEQAEGNLAIYAAALDGELRALGSSADDSPVDDGTWARVRRDIERSYVEVAGVDGVIGALDSIDVGGILLDAIKNAPGVFAEAVGEAAGTVLKAAGQAAGKGVGGIFSGLGLVGTVVLVLVLLVVLGVHFTGRSA